VTLTLYGTNVGGCICSTPDVLDYQPEDVLVAILPLFHIYGQVVVLLTALSGGSRIVTLPRFEPESYLQTVSKQKVLSRLQLAIFHFFVCFY
jgi:acyl-CoA synthetase (AMP-forming)/AMP-acid ligase II